MRNSRSSRMLLSLMMLQMAVVIMLFPHASRLFMSSISSSESFLMRFFVVFAPAEDDEDGAQIRAALSGQVAQSLANDLLIGFMEAARDSAGVDIDQAAINAVHSQFP